MSEAVWPTGGFRDFLDNLCYWLKAEHCLVGTIVPSNDPLVADVNIASEDDDDVGEDEDPSNTFYIGNYGEPGVRVKWLGEHTISGKVNEGGGPRDRTFVEVNGVVFEALGRHVAGWVTGYQ